MTSVISKGNVAASCCNREPLTTADVTTANATTADSTANVSTADVRVWIRVWVRVRG